MLWNYAHGWITEPLWHVQNFVAKLFHARELLLSKISIEFELCWKNGSWNWPPDYISRQGITDDTEKGFVYPVSSHNVINITMAYWLMNLEEHYTQHCFTVHSTPNERTPAYLIICCLRSVCNQCTMAGPDEIFSHYLVQKTCLHVNLKQSMDYTFRLIESFPALLVF